MKVNKDDLILDLMGMVVRKHNELELVSDARNHWIDQATELRNEVIGLREKVKELKARKESDN